MWMLIYHAVVLNRVVRAAAAETIPVCVNPLSWRAAGDSHGARIRCQRCHLAVTTQGMLRGGCPLMGVHLSANEIVFDWLQARS